MEPKLIFNVAVAVFIGVLAAVGAVNAWPGSVAPAVQACSTGR